MVYNLTAINATSLLSFTTGVNTVLMQGQLFNLLLIALAFILFSSFYFMSQDSAKSLAGTAFICFGLSLFLVALQLITTQAFFITLVAAALGIAATWKSSSI
jgi:predicted neutral ceramidase superfamily lipid hydrolase